MAGAAEEEAEEEDAFSAPFFEVFGDEDAGDSHGNDGEAHVEADLLFG